MSQALYFMSNVTIKPHHNPRKQTHHYLSATDKKTKACKA